MLIIIFIYIFKNKKKIVPTTCLIKISQLSIYHFATGKVFSFSTKLPLSTDKLGKRNLSRSHYFNEASIVGLLP